MKKSYREIYAILELGDKTVWHRIGTAFKNKDGSDNLVFTLLPTDKGATIQVRDPKPRDETATQSAEAEAAAQ